LNVAAVERERRPDAVERRFDTILQARFDEPVVAKHGVDEFVPHRALHRPERRGFAA